MSDRVFDARVARGIAPDDRARQERLKATARALVTAVRDGLVRDGFVRLHGFGTFRLRPVAARRGRHPRTGEPIEIPAGWRVLFRPAKALRERVEPDRAPSLPIGEPHASREAMLAAGATPQARQPDAGRIPAGAPAAAKGAEEERPRAAAAAIPEAKLSAHGPIPPLAADLEADTRVTRSPAALTRAPLSVTDAPPPAASVTEPSRGAAPASQSPQSPPGPVETRGRRPRHRAAVLVLLLLLIAGLAWLLRPGGSPEPPLAEKPAVSSNGATSADSSEGMPDTGATGTGASGDRSTAAADPAPASDATDPDRRLAGAVAAQVPAPAVSGDVAGNGGVAAPDGAEEVATDTTGTETAGTETAGRETAGTETAGTETAGTETTGAETAGTETAGTETAGAETAGTETAGTETAGTETAGTETAGTETAGTETAGTETAGTETAGTETAGTETAGTETASTETASTETASTETASTETTRTETTSTETTRTETTSTETTSTETTSTELASTERASTERASTERASTETVSTPTVGTQKSGTAAVPYFNGRDYTVRSGDTLWDLADRHYANPYYWPHIWNHNGDISNPNRLEIRQGIWLPSLEGEPRSLTEGDRRSIAEGYLRLYRFFRAQGDANPQYALVGVRHFDQSVLPERLRGSAAARPGDTLAAAFQARLEAEFPLD